MLSLGAAPLFEVLPWRTTSTSHCSRRAWPPGTHGVTRTPIIPPDLIKADLSGANLRGADLRGAYLIGADLDGTNDGGQGRTYPC
jgi:hypothetical protein